MSINAANAQEASCVLATQKRTEPDSFFEEKGERYDYLSPVSYNFLIHVMCASSNLPNFCS
jgi:hypothetical protein